MESLKQKCQELELEGEKMEINCVFDGACEPVNPGGNMGYGAAIFHGRDLIEKYSGFTPAAPGNTNNVAEYKSVLWLIDYITNSLPFLLNHQIRIYGDSKLVINQQNGDFRINKGFYVPYANEAKTKIKVFKDLKFIWVPREKNSYADFLSTSELKNHNIKVKKWA